MTQDLTVSTGDITGGDSKIDRTDFSTPLGEIKSHLDDIVNGDQVFENLKLITPSTLTISSGAVTVTQAAHTLAAESGTADDLDTINGTVAGRLYTFKADTGDTITLKHGTGNIDVVGGLDLELSGDHTVIAYSDGTTVSITGNGGGTLDIAGLSLGGIDPAADYIPYYDANLGTNRKVLIETFNPDRKIAEGEIFSPISTISLGSIPADYYMLDIHLYLRGNTAAINVGMDFKLNADATNGNYYAIVNQLNASGIFSSAETLGSNPGFSIGRAAPAGSSPANWFSTWHFRIFNYADTTNYKAVEGRGSVLLDAATGDLYSVIVSGLYLSSSPISSVQVISKAFQWVSGSRYAIYGKGIAR